MTRRQLCLIILVYFLGACASPQHEKGAEQIRTSIDDALAEAISTGEMEETVEIPEAEVPPDDILDELLPASGIAVQGLDDNLRQELAFDISVSNAPARLFFMSLVKQTSVNMMVHPSVEGEVSLDLKNVTVREVMKLMRDVYGYEYRENDTGFIVMPARIQSRVFPVNYLNVDRTGESIMTVSSGQIEKSPSGDNDSNNSSSSIKNAVQSSRLTTTNKADFWSQLQGTLSTIVGAAPGRSVIVDRNAGLVIVRAMPGELRDVENYLNSAQDSIQRQVILEAKIIEVTLDDGFQSGIDWAAISSNRNFGIANSSVVGGVTGSSPGSIDINAAGDVVVTSGLDLSNRPFSNLFAASSSSSTFGALITLLNTQGTVHVLSSPRVSTVNNQKAVIKVGSDEFFVTDISSTNNSNAVGTTSTPELTLTPFFSGIALDVTPQISADGEVILHIHPSITEVTDQNKVIVLGGEIFELPLALSTVRESDSIVKARNGQVVVIGGLMKNVSSDNESGVPGLSDVPAVGELFKQKQKATRRSELVILLRPIVVDNGQIWSSYIKDSADRINNLNTIAEGE